MILEKELLNFMLKNNMPHGERTTITQTRGSFDDRAADKWWESRWAFIMAIALPLIAVMASYAALQINDTKQSDDISNIESQQTLFQQGDFKDSQQRVTDLTTAVNELTVKVAELQTIINERIPAK